MELNKVSLQSAKIQLDEQIKKLLAQKVILAWILHRNVHEFSGMELSDIIGCIEGEPEIGTRPVNPGETNTEISGMSNEDNVPGEGRLYYDIIFYVRIPRDRDIMKMIINVEAQKSFYPGYHIETRGVFYAARGISAQKHREFENSAYDSIKKVYSIWLCMNAPQAIGNAISEYSFCKKDILPGIPDNREAYDKMTVVIVALNQKAGSTDRFIELMNTLISTTMSVNDKRMRLEYDFGIHVSSDMEERMNDMCNYSDLIEEEAMKRGMEKGLEQGMEKGLEQGIEKGLEQGIEKGLEQGMEKGLEQGLERGIRKGLEEGKILARYEDGMASEEIARKMGLTVKQVEDVLIKNNVLIMA